jgi:hypothetical protein
MPETVFIAGVPFLALCHRDGRLIRASGLFVFARREGRRRTILHMELAEAINRHAGPSHPRWAWALAQGLNELLVSLASSSGSIEAATDGPEVVWHPEAEFWPAEEPAFWPAPLEATISRLAASAT